MSDKLLEIAKANGAVGYQTGQVVEFRGEYQVFSANQLRSTIEQVCAPLVAALDCFDRDITYENGHAIQGIYWQDVQAAREALRDVRALIGDKE